MAPVILSWTCFWRVGESASVRPCDLLGAGGVSFYRTKSGGPKGWHRRPLFKFGMCWVGYLSEYCKRQGLPVDEPTFSGAEAVLEDCLTTLLRGSRWSDYAWHSLRRRGTAPFGTKSLDCPTLNGGGVELLPDLPCATRQLSWIMECWRRWPCHALDRRSGSLRWSIAYLFGVLLCLGRTMWKSPWVTWGPSLVLLSHVLALWLLSRLRRWWGAAAVALLAMNRTLLLQAPRAPTPASHPTRIIEPRVGKGVIADPAFRIGAEERLAGSGQGGGVGRRKGKPQAPPPTTRERPGRRRVRPVGVPSDPEGGGGQVGPQVGVEAICFGIPPTPL